jgi:hypothetical protein
MARFHPDVETLRSPGGIFDVEPCELDLHVGRLCRFVNPSCPAESGEHLIAGLQKNYRGEICYRVVTDSDSFGRVARPSEVELS